MIRLLPAGLRGRLFLLVTVAMLPALGLVSYDAVRLRSATVDAAIANARSLARLSAEAHRHRLNVAHSQLRRLAGDPRLSADDRRCDAILASELIEHSVFANVMVAGVDGSIECSALPITRPARIGEATRNALLRHAADRETVTEGEYTIGPVSSRPVLLTGLPVGGTGAGRRLVLVALDVGWVSQFVAEALLPAGATMEIVDAGGRMIARFPSAGGYVGRSVLGTPSHAAILRRIGEGTARGLAIDGVDRVYSFALLGDTVDGRASYVSIGIPLASLYAVSNRALRHDLLLLLGALVIAVAAAWMLSDATVVRPLRAMLGATHRLARGDLSARAGLRHGIGEIESLREAFDEMAASLERRSVDADRSARALEESESRFRLLAEHARDLVCLHLPDGRLHYVSPSSRQTIGFDPEELIGQNVLDLAHEDDAPRLRAELQAMTLGATPPPLTFRARTKGGEYRWLEAIVQPIRDADGSLVQLQTTSRDVTERKRAEEQLRAERDYVRHIIEVTPALVYGVEADGVTTFVNPAVELTTGYRADELIGRNVLQILYPDMAAKRLDQLAAALRRGPLRDYEMQLTTKAGERRTVSWNSLNRVSDDGNVTELIGFGIDVTERNGAEQERLRLEAQLRNAQKLEAVGQLAAGIAHEINTPTQYIGDNMRFLSDSFASLASVVDDYRTVLGEHALSIDAEAVARFEAADLPFLLAEIPSAITQSLEGVERVARIVRAMKEFSHPGSDEKSPLDLNRAIESTVTVATNEWKYVAKVVTDFDESLPLVPARAGELNQAILNLVVNAAQAITEARTDELNDLGRITISTGHCGDWAEVRIADTGTGIPAAILDRIFDPFFTTKPVGKGTGQGLAICHSVIVERHGGSISVESEPGVGTTFFVRLPLTAPPADGDNTRARDVLEMIG